VDTIDKAYLSDNPVQSTACISTGENVFVHKEAPDEILVLPYGADTSDLKEENTIVIEEVVNLT
jgi:hypothetical protein